MTKAVEECKWFVDEYNRLYEEGYGEFLDIKSDGANDCLHQIKSLIADDGKDALRSLICLSIRYALDDVGFTSAEVNQKVVNRILDGNI